MKIGIGNYYLRKYGLPEGAAKMAEDGYEYADLNFSDTESEFYTSTEDNFFLLAGRYKSALTKHGVSVLQIHGPWCCPPKDADEQQRAELFGKMTKALGIARFFGAKYMAVHPLMPFGENSDKNANEVYEINKRFYTSLSSVAGKLGVTVCLENMPFKNFPLSETEKIMELLRDVNSPHLKLCLDTGHANMFEKPIREVIHDAGADYLRILHVHDNSGQRDAHLPPYEGNVDWGDFAEALYDVGFDGVISLETSPESFEGFARMSADEQREREIYLSRLAKLIAGI